ncbi:MAG: 2-oxoacid:acceptor oxidoreductase family protein [Candidatus Marsarchaeota archaeon]|nr:2-oxoacid:acceptor oxidoreductase family protein [Candidatus Marsarchaeota archaeon]
MNREEIVIGGFGGQGIILAGYIVGKAAAIYDKKNVTFTQDYGPEARGGACRAQVVISDSQVSYPYVERPSVLAVMSQEAYTRYTPALRPDGCLLIDEELVKPDKTNREVFAVPATRIAQELGRAAVANIVMLGFLTAVTKIVSTEAIKKSVLDSVPKGTGELNMKAFERGYACGLEKLKAKK